VKLHCLTINGYKNLNGVKIEFANAGQAVVFVGQNGSGKSNLIEALATIFRDLTDRTITPFGYDISYSIGSRYVRILNSGLDGRRQYWLANEGFGQLTKINEQEFYSGQALTPANVFGYYSGSRQHLPEIFEQSERQHLLELLGHEPSVSLDFKKDEYFILTPSRLRSPFYGHLEAAPIALLSLMAAKDPGFTEFLDRELGVTAFSGALLTLRRSSELDASRISKLRRPITRDLAGGLDGDATRLLNDIWSLSLMPFDTEFELEDDGLSTPTSDNEIRSYLFIPNAEALAELVVPGSPPRGAPEIFAILENLQRLGVLTEVKVWVQRKGKAAEISSSDFSDGERQLLTICGLLNLTPEEETLFLLDEPDTHLNPAWKWDFLQTILEQAGDCSKSQLVLTTHDPMTLASLTKDQVFVVYHDPETGEANVDHPPVDPRGLGVAGVLRQVFGMRSTLDPETQKLIGERNRLLADRQRDVAQEEQLAELTQEIRTLGISMQSQQDMFEQFLKELNRQDLVARPLTPKEVTQQNRDIERALSSLKGEAKH
jgi:ABC-type multidrug transport system ATPase subunit